MWFSLTDDCLTKKRKKKKRKWSKNQTLRGKWRLQFSGQAAEAAADNTRGSKGLSNSEHCKYPARAWLRNELLQTNQAALNQHAWSFWKGEGEAIMSAAHTWKDTWYERWEQTLSKDLMSFFSPLLIHLERETRITTLRAVALLKASPSTPADYFPF